MSPAKRAAVYVRVSSGMQHEANQVPDVERLVAARGLDVVARYEETASAAKKRPEYERMTADAKGGAFDVLVVWSLDRFGRSMVGNVNDVLALDAAGVQVVSCMEPWLDTRSPVRDLLLAIFSWVAEQERRRIIERTRAGMARARTKGTASGKAIGRPRRLARPDVERIVALAAEGRSVRAIAVALKVPRETVRRALATQNGVPASASGTPGETAAEPPAGETTHKGPVVGPGIPGRSHG